MARNKPGVGESRTPEQSARLARILQPLPVVRYYPGKSWAGALISNLDDAFGIGRLGRGSFAGVVTEGDYDASHPARVWED